MDKQDFEQKIKNVKSGKSSTEIFMKPRPPEEFGDAVELSYNKELNCFEAIVFDPDMKTIYDEKAFHDEDKVKAFIHSTID